MNIKRIVNGIEMEFELTAIEMSKAHHELEIASIVEDINEQIDSGDYEGAENFTDETIRDIALVVEDNLMCDGEYHSIYEDAITNTIKYYLDEEEDDNGDVW